MYILLVSLARAEIRLGLCFSATARAIVTYSGKGELIGIIVCPPVIDSSFYDVKLLFGQTDLTLI